MSSDLSSKVQNVLWWITSIATSVVCCSVIFVLFASYFVDLRQDIKAGNLRINMIEQQEDKILAEVELIRKHTMEQQMSATPTAVAAPAPLAGTGLAPAPGAIPPPAQPAASLAAPGIQLPPPPATPAPAAPAVIAHPSGGEIMHVAPPPASASGAEAHVAPTTQTIPGQSPADVSAPEKK